MGMTAKKCSSCGRKSFGSIFGTMNSVNLKPRISGNGTSVRLCPACMEAVEEAFRAMEKRTPIRVVLSTVVGAQTELRKKVERVERKRAKVATLAQHNSGAGPSETEVATGDSQKAA